MKNNKLKIYKVLSFMIISVLLLNILNTNIIGLTNPSLNITSEKIDAALYSKMEMISENERIYVWVWLKPIENEVIYEKIKKEKNIDIKVFENEQKFNKEIKPLIKAKIIKELQDIEECKINSENTDTVNFLRKQKINDKINNEVQKLYKDYIEAKRAVIREEYLNKTSDFILKNTPVNRKVLYKSNYSSTLIIEATKNEVLHYASLNSVERLSLYIQTAVEPDMAISLEQVGVYCDGGTGFDSYDGWLAYSGLGMKVGILEAQCGRYDSSSPHLINNSRLSYVNNIRADGTIVPGTVSNHATIVTSIIAGQTVQSLSRYYTGIVPAATVYQTSVYMTEDVFTGIQHLIDRGVYVINYSAGLPIPGIYTDFDRELDNIIKNTGVIFIKSAGNDGNTSGYINQGAASLNSIVVGNCATKPSPYSFGSIPYEMYMESSYEEADYLPNKPDISAPGTNIFIANTAHSVLSSGNGTSFSAPTVAGIVTQMLQAKPSLIGNPTAVKALLLLGADEFKISAVNNELVGNCMREKSGVGFVNAINSVNNALDLDTLTVEAVPHTPTETARFYCNAGQKIRAVMTFDKRNDVLISSDSDIDDVDLTIWNESNFSINASSMSIVNNVEIIEYTVPVSGYYYFDLVPWVLEDDNPPYMSLAYRLY